MYLRIIHDSSVCIYTLCGAVQGIWAKPSNASTLRTPVTKQDLPALFIRD